jgi:putative transposase
MRKSRFTEAQIMAILGEGEAGLPVAQVCRKHEISTATYYQWKSKYAGMSVSELKRVKDLEAENSRLKRMYAELALENAGLHRQEAAHPRSQAVPPTRSDPHSLA